MWRSAASASACRPERVRASACSAQTRSRSGYLAVASSVAATTTAWSPRASRPRTRASSASSRSWSSDVRSRTTSGSSGRSAYASPVHSPSSSSIRSTLREISARVGQSAPGPVVSWRGERCQRPVAGADLVGEAVRVDVLAAERQPVAVVAGQQDPGLLPRAQARLEDASYAGEVGVQGAVGAARRVLAPDQPHQRVGRDVAAEPEGQRGQDRARLAGADAPRWLPDRRRAPPGSFRARGPTRAAT